MRVLVTGGCGFIGSHLVDALLARGHAVTVLDNLSTGSKDNLRAHLTNPNFRFIKGDIRDGKAVKKSISGVDAVVHEAAMISVPLSIKEPRLAQEVNVGGTLSLLEASRKAGVKRFVCASSCAVYGDPDKLPVAEDALLKPSSPYASSKLAAEEGCRKFFELGLPTVSLRYFNVYGPRQSGGEYVGVMAKFIERLRDSRPPIIYGDGRQTRDFVYVSDVVEATLLALERDGVAGEVINIGTGRETSINKLCELFLKLTGNKALKSVHKPPRVGDVRRSRADITKARKLLGFKPRVALEQGAKKLLKSVGGL